MKLSLIIIKLPDIIQKFFPVINYQDFKTENKFFFSKDNKLSCYFHADEIKIINQFTTFKRQIEWICGRLTIKKLVEQYTDQKYISPNIIISSKENGAPFLKAFPCWGLSISHSNEFAIGALCYKNNRRIGIDIEKIEGPKSQDFIDLAFTKKEIQELSNKPVEQLYKKWTIKESFLKVIEMGFNESLKKVEVLNNNLYYYNQLMKYVTIRTEKINNDYIYSLVVHTRNENYTLEIGRLEPGMLEEKKYIAVA